MAAVTEELRTDGWLVNQTRMWLASQWTVRAGADWRVGEDAMYVHLLDGSRASNRLGWQWTTGTGSGKTYGFSRWQVEKRASSLCRRCPLRDRCPIQDWPDAELGPAVEGPDLGRGVVPAGPESVQGAQADQVWLTAESLGTDDPALAADADRPAVFVFDEPLLRRLRLSAKRLVFLAETLGELAERRPLEVRRGRVLGLADYLDDMSRLRPRSHVVVGCRAGLGLSGRATVAGGLSESESYVCRVGCARLVGDRAWVGCGDR